MFDTANKLLLDRQIQRGARPRSYYLQAASDDFEGSTSPRYLQSVRVRTATCSRESTVILLWVMTLERDELALKSRACCTQS